MNRSDIQVLQSVREHPALSILLPTHRGHTDNRQDAIRLRNLMDQAAERLLSKFPKREVQPVLQNLETLTNQIDYRHLSDGLALFVGREFARQMYLPFTVKERVIINYTFATRDLVHALNRTPRYWVLVLSEKPTRLYEGTGETLVEVTHGGFPLIYEGPGVTEPMPAGYGIRRSAHRDEFLQRFFREAYHNFAQLNVKEYLPLIVIGVERYLAFFDEVSKNKLRVWARIAGSHDKTPPRELAKLVTPILQESIAKERHETMQELQEAMAHKRSVSGITKVWRSAQQGRGVTLLVEENYRCAAYADADRMNITPMKNGSVSAMIYDAVDEVIEIVLAKGGRVVFVEDGALNDHKHIALILRY